MHPRPPLSPFMILIIPLIPIRQAFAETLHVPADHPTIQSCIDAATNGDECVVAPGTYNELINFLGKAITLRSSHGPEVTTIDGTGLTGSVVKITSDETRQTVFDGFTVTHGTGEVVKNSHSGGGMYILDSSPLIRNSIFKSNKADLGGGIYNTGSPAIQHCQFMDNDAQNGAGIFNGIESDTLVYNCTFQFNVALEEGAGIFNHQSRSRIERCIFLLNQARNGAGLRNLYSTVDVVDCDFDDNGAYGSGAGMANGESPNSIVQFGKPARRPTFDIYNIRGSQFRWNESYGGHPMHGGCAIYDNARATTITGSYFELNTASGYGGAVLSVSNGLTVRQCSFLGNSSSYQGGALYGAGEVEASTFEFNSAPVGNGGAIAANNGGKWNISDSAFISNWAASGGATYGPGEIRHCTFLYNQAQWYSGGAVYSPTTLSHSYFAGNQATLAGGALYTDRSTRLLNSVFLGNEANSGGAIFNDLHLSVFNCSLANNFARGHGGAIANQQSDKPAHSLAVSNSIMLGNTASVGGNQIWSGPVPFDTTIFFSNIQGSGGSENWDASIGLDAGGNLDLDSEFVRIPDDGLDGWGDDPVTFGIDESLNDDFGDLHLQPGSPCINAGDPAYPFIPGDSDLDGHPRVLCGRIDMGAYESGIGDYNCDQTVTLADFSSLPVCMTDPEFSVFKSQIKNRQSKMETSCSSFNFDADSDVDLLDLAEFQNLFTAP